MHIAPIAIRQAYRWKFRVLTRAHHGKGWRQRLAWLLRRAAQRVDGLGEFVLAIDSTPRLSAEQLAVCIERGFKAMEQAVELEVRAEAHEVAMRRAAPHLYEDAS